MLLRNEGKLYAGKLIHSQNC